jgi:hypothetical protein
MKKRLKLQAALLAALANSTYAADTCLPEDVGSKSPLLVFQCFEAKLNRQQEQIQTQQTEIQTLKMRLSLTDGLVAYYPFEGNANDASGFENHGTEHGNINYVPGKHGRTAHFDGKAGHIEIQPDNSLSVDFITIVAWIYRVGNCPTVNDTCMIFNQEHSYELGIRSGNTLQWAIKADTDWFWYNTGAEIAQKQWLHIALTFDGVSVKSYLNGKVVNTKAYSGKINKVDRIAKISGRDASGIISSPFNGKIDELRIYNRALTDREIQSLYKQP